MNNSFMFNGEQREYLYLNPGWKIPPWAPIDWEIVEVPGRDGGYLKKKKVSVLSLEVPVTFYANDVDATIEEVKEDLADWLLHDEEKELIFAQNPERVFYVVVDGSLDLDELVVRGKGTITFIAPDASRHARQEKVDVSDDTTGLHILTVDNRGGKETYPIIEMKSDGDYTHINITNGNQVNWIGREVDLEQYQPKKRLELIWHDTLATTTGWATETGIKGFDGVATGTITSNGYSFQPSSFGTVSSAWHGPVLKKSIGKPLTNFQLEARMEFTNPQFGLYGRAEIYLLNDLNEVVGKIALKNTSGNDKKNVPEARAGDGTTHRYLIDGDDYVGYSNFYGIVKLIRVGKTWAASFTVIDKATGLQESERLYETYYDKDDQFIRQPTQVAIHFGQYGSKPTALLAVHDVWIYQINELTDAEIPYVVKKDDVITFDHVKKRILVNGEDRIDLKAFGAEFFPLEKGMNIIQSYPSLPMTCRYKERFK